MMLSRFCVKRLQSPRSWKQCASP